MEPHTEDDDATEFTGLEGCFLAVAVYISRASHLILKDLEAIKLSLFTSNYSEDEMFTFQVSVKAPIPLELPKGFLRFGCQILAPSFLI